VATELKHTVKPSGGDYTTLDAAIDHLVASHANLVTADKYALVEIGGTWSSADTAAVTVAGLTTSATCYLFVYTDAANRATASALKTDRYRLQTTNAKAVYLDDNYSYWDGLQIATVGVNGNDQHVFHCNGVTSVTLSNCRLTGANSETYYQTIARMSNTAVLYNCIIENGGQVTATIGIRAYGTTVDAYNCVVRNCHEGVNEVSGALSMYDSCILDCTHDWNVGAAVLMSYCAIDDAYPSAPSGNEVAESGGGAGWPLDFTDAANGDFTLLATSNLVGAGGMAGSGTFSNDIEGTVRGAAWDVGPYEYVSSGYTLACDGGSYALTGTAASPLKGSLVAADAGSYALTGQDAGVYYGRAIDADAGAYSLSGADTTLLRAAKIIPEAGAYALTGQAVGTLWGRLLAAEAGAYTLTGQDIAALLGRLIAAEAGGYVVTGQDAAALFGRKLAAEAGSYLVTGQDVTLIYTPGGGTYVLTAEGGVYAVTGYDAATIWRRPVGTEGGLVKRWDGSSWVTVNSIVVYRNP
jgi:hypothetical protein